MGNRWLDRFGDHRVFVSQFARSIVGNDPVDDCVLFVVGNEMTKLAIMSDLHLRHWKATPGARGLNKLLYRLDQWFKVNQPDVVIDAGDTELPHLIDEITNGIRYVRVNGNHDYYGRHWNGPFTDCQTISVHGLPDIVMATLWTDMCRGDPNVMLAVQRGMNDFNFIKGFSVGLAAITCKQHQKYITSMLTPRCVVVTHHAPSWKSVHPKYQNGLISWGFASELDALVESSEAKLWIHGHTHSEFDYKIGETRVLCHPCGYPGERSKPYEPLLVEI